MLQNYNLHVETVETTTADDEVEVTPSTKKRKEPTPAPEVIDLDDYPDTQPPTKRPARFVLLVHAYIARIVSPTANFWFFL